MQLFVNVKDLVAVAVAVIFLLFFLGTALVKWSRQKLCKHENFFENGACHAKCRKCRKDLGFIGTWREKVASKKT